MLKSLIISRFFAIIFIAIQAIITSSAALNSNQNIWQGIVISVTDGDTLRVRPISSPQSTSLGSPLTSSSKVDSLRIRIDGIDAPESCQQYGAASAEALKKLVLSKQVTITSKRVDDYGRDVAKVTVDNVDVAGWMVKNGHAWSYHYRFSKGPYGTEEKAAERDRLGLFADASAVNPKIFRREHGSCYVANNKVTKNNFNMNMNGNGNGNGSEHDRKRYK
jgi:micrococcal nuclease